MGLCEDLKYAVYDKNICSTALELYFYIISVLYCIVKEEHDKIDLVQVIIKFKFVMKGLCTNV